MKFIPKVANRIPFICGQKKFCFGKHKLIPKSNCNCVKMCKLEQPIYIISDFKCQLTNDYKSSKNCDCVEICIVSKSEINFIMNS